MKLAELGREKRKMCRITVEGMRLPSRRIFDFPTRLASVARSAVRAKESRNLLTGFNLGEGRPLALCTA